MARARSPGEVNCMRCGRGNPEHVRYCLDCGSELHTSHRAQPEFAEARSDLVEMRSEAGRNATAAVAAYGNGQPSTRTITGRPPAPDLHFGARPRDHIELSDYGASLASVAGGATASNDVTRCNSCGVDNPRDSSFCCECGSPLRLGAPRPLGGTIVAVGSAVGAERGAGARAEVAPTQSQPDAAPVAQVVQPVPETKPAGTAGPAGTIVPAPTTSAPTTEPVPTTVDGTLASRREPSSQEPSRICSRCQGTNSPEARFCQLCGVPLTAPGERHHDTAAPVSSGPVSKVMPDAWLVVIGQDGAPGRRYPLKGPKMDIGRQSGDTILDKDPYVCPLHARVTYGTRGFAIEDLGSVNGVYVRLGGSPVELRHGDLLLLGQAVLRFEIVEETERSISPAVRDSTRVFGTPAVPRRARLVVHTVEGCGRDIFYLSRPETILGREAGDIVFTDDPFMSRRHAALRRASATNTYTLRDLGSSNGTFIAIRGQQPLSPGDHVRIGQHLFRLDVQSGGPS